MKKKKTAKKRIHGDARLFRVEVQFVLFIAAEDEEMALMDAHPR